MSNAEREAARLRGEFQYASDHPCRRGHIGLRAVCDDKCITCRLEWQQAHKENGRVAARRWRARNPQKHLAAVARWLSVPANQKIKKAAMRRWKLANAEWVAFYQRDRVTHLREVNHGTA